MNSRKTKAGDCKSLIFCLLSLINSLTFNKDFFEQMKQLIENIRQQQLSESEQTGQIKCTLLKYEIRKFAITYPKKISQNAKRSECKLEKLKELESNLNSEGNFNEYTKCKNDLELIYERIPEGVKIRAKCQWYEEG